MDKRNELAILGAVHKEPVAHVFGVIHVIPKRVYVLDAAHALTRVLQPMSLGLQYQLGHPFGRAIAKEFGHFLFVGIFGVRLVKNVIGFFPQVHTSETM